MNTSSTISVPIVNDSIVEETEMFSVTLRTEGQGSGVSLFPGVANVTIVDDDGGERSRRMDWKEREWDWGREGWTEVGKGHR